MELRDEVSAALGPNFVLEQELMGGGMARVFVALDQALGRRIVIKTLSPDRVGDVSADRFRREVQIAASLQQANIVPLLTAGEMDGVPYYTMPFVEGESLRSRLLARGAHSIAETIGILRDVARALAFAHDRGVVHRDIKPDNILQSGSTAVVTDFGIAKALAAARTGTSPELTGFGVGIGTPTYMAPEQVVGDLDADHRADLYALGVVGYELLAGAPPFMGRTAQATLVAQMVERPAPIRERRAETPVRLAALIMQCLEKEPADRPATAHAVLLALESALLPESDAGIPPRTKPSIAVMPFANLSPDPADEYFADGLTDEIITDLSPIRALHVIARSSMMRFKGTDKSAATVARELGVRYVLDGSVRRAGNSLRLTARLIDTTDDVTVWTDKLGGSLDDIFEMQERISRTIVDALAVVITPREDLQLSERPIADLRAYEFYLQARQSIWTFTVASLDRARLLLEEAQRLVGDNPRLLGALGGLHLNYVDSGLGGPGPHVAAAEACATELEALEPDSFNARYLRGWLDFRRGAIREAMTSLGRAVELEPNNPDALMCLCYVCILAGSDRRARELADAVVKLDPLTPLFQCAPGFCSIVTGHARQAIGPYRRFFEMDQGNPAAHFFLAWVLYEANERDESLRVADQLTKQFPGNVFAQMGVVLAHGLRGDHEAGRTSVSPELRAMAQFSEMFGRLMASVLASVGDVEGAIDAMEGSVRLGNSHYPFLARDAAGFEELRAQPRFQKLLEVVRGRWERGGTSAADLRE